MAEEKLVADAVRPTGKRPSGKRQATGTPAVASKSVRAKESDDSLKGTRNPITFLKQVIDELRKVIWPTARQMVTYTAVVLLFLAFMILLVWGIDTLTGLGIRSVLSK